ncbi:hypothetical protein CH063_15224, partial [Colletotrichum higginsianum]
RKSQRRRKAYRVAQIVNVGRVLHVSEPRHELLGSPEWTLCRERRSRRRGRGDGAILQDLSQVKRTGYVVVLDGLVAGQKYKDEDDARQRDCASRREQHVEPGRRAFLSDRVSGREEAEPVEGADNMQCGCVPVSSSLAYRCV